MKNHNQIPNQPLSIDNSGEEPVSNSSNNPYFGNMALNNGRRTLLKGGLGVALSSFIVGNLGACGQVNRNPVRAEKTSLLGFTAIDASRADQVQVPPGYRARLFSPWGEPLNGVAPAYNPDGNNTAEQQLQQKGSHHDGMHFFPIDVRKGGQSSVEGLLVTNHEYVDVNVLHAEGPTLSEQRPAEEVYKEMAAHGVSIQHIKKQSGGHWQVVSNSPYNRRITGSSAMQLSGPARGHAKCRTAFSPTGQQARGTLNNCSHGVTPWNTYLTAEENWAGYFINREANQPREHSRYGVATEQSRYHWERADNNDSVCTRFDAVRQADNAEKDFRHEPNTFGWMVEVDPFDASSTPRKRTALGRFAHEGVIFAKAREGEPVVCYSGDDARFEYIYKFVSKNPYRASDAGGHLLDEGTLYVAQFKEDGTGQWLPLDLNDADFAGRARLAGVEFTDQGDLLINTRLAADVAGATKMDRPEWGAIDPETGEVYFTLTNNIDRTPKQTNSANPRANNAAGHIIRWREEVSYGGATKFQWDILVLAGDLGTRTPDIGSSKLSHTPVELSEKNHFASPDGLWFDPRGVLWIQTDMSGSQRSDGPFGNNQMLAADPTTGDIRRFLVGPVECEVTGVVSTPDLKTMFVNIQHPGETSEPGRFTSHWPDGGSARPRSATVIIEREDGGVIGT